ncbi:MAG: cytochrome c oxidase accessory protein CcoG [Ignavibacteria bacterium]|nr:cytochrome c oxidase accessory protein CcoG [Ignavibacteria bacterium]
MTQENETQEIFRDKISIVNKEGKRKWVYPRKPKGKLYNLRTLFSIFLLAVLFGTPFIKYDGHSLFLLNFVERKFILFGVPFVPQDFYLFGIAMISIIVFVILFTVIFGRLFCGWACPQTVFLEMVFRKIEYWIEGDASKQRKLNAEPWTGSKIFKKFSKWGIFYGISFLIGNTFLAYIIGIEELKKIVTDNPSNHLTGLFLILLFSSAFYFVFAYFREYACIYVCPYGRLQGVLLDKNSIVIAYDHKRGEPRGKIRKAEERTAGDCIDCKMCVDVCPTGIDIRNGTQLECVNCTACVDACNSVMVKIDKPKGLIRYDSAIGIETGKKFKITPREIGYSIVLTILIILQVVLFSNRREIDVNILRTPGLLFQEQPDNRITNLYNINLANKTFKDVPVTLKLNNLDGEIKLIGNDLVLPPAGVTEGKFLVYVQRDKIKMMNTPFVVQVWAGDKLINELETSFNGPVNSTK